MTCSFYSGDKDVFKRHHPSIHPVEKLLRRHFYIKVPKEMALQEDTVLLVVKPMYGIPESGLHWYIKYLEYPMENLKMTGTTAHPCVLVKRKEGEVIGTVALQVDDSLS